MTEYDFSPEGYRRQLATQARIAKWVDQTHQHSADFRPQDSDLTRDMRNPVGREDLDNLLGPGESISQFNPSPPPLPFYGPPQPPQRQYPGQQYPIPQAYYAVPGPTPFGLYQQSPHRHSSSSSHHHDHHHRSRSHPRKSSRSHRSPSPTYIITPPGPSPYAYQGVPAAPGSILAMSPPVSPPVPGVPPPSYVVVPRGKTVQVMSPPISPQPQNPYSNGYLQAYPPQPYPAQLPSYPPQPYPAQPMYGSQSAQPTQSYFTPQQLAPPSGPPTFIPAANAHFLSAPVSRGNTLKKKGYGSPPEWRRSF